MSSFLITLLVSCAVSFVLTAVLARLAPRLSWGDAPTLPRKLQDRPVPPVGGAAILCGWAVAASLTGFETPFGLARGAVLASIALAFAVGTVDDLRAAGLRPLAKLLLQGAAALPLALAAAERFGDGPAGAFLAGALALAAALAAMNLANTFDHADGALGGVAALGFLCSGTTAAAGALAGFLPWNLDAGRRQERSSPTAYLGDAGSHLLGLLLLVQPAAWPVFLLPALDLLRLTVERTRAGSRPWIGDRRHLSHLLAATGLPPRGVALRLALASVPACVGGLLANGSAPSWLLGLFGSTCLYVWMQHGARSSTPAPAG